jgi:hypothetical protein
MGGRASSRAPAWLLRRLTWRQRGGGSSSSPQRLRAPLPLAAPASGHAAALHAAAAAAAFSFSAAHAQQQRDRSACGYVQQRTAHARYLNMMESIHDGITARTGSR